MLASRPGEALVSISSAGKDLGAQKFTYTAPPGPDPLPNFCERWPRLCIDINERSVFELPPQYELPRDVDVREEIIKPRIELELER